MRMDLRNNSGRVSKRRRGGEGSKLKWNGKRIINEDRKVTSTLGKIVRGLKKWGKDKSE